jgi:hypothetical protein
MHIAIVTFDGFNELDSLVALGILNRIKRPAWRVSIACPSARVRSMNGLVIEAQASLSDANAADAVIVGSGVSTRSIVKDPAIMAELRLDPAKQVLGAQCSGTLILAKLGLLNGVSACTDLTTSHGSKKLEFRYSTSPSLPGATSRPRGAASRRSILRSGSLPDWRESRRRKPPFTTWRRWEKKKNTLHARCAISNRILRSKLKRRDKRLRSSKRSPLAGPRSASPGKTDSRQETP